MRFSTLVRCALVIGALAGGISVLAAQSGGARRAMTIEDLIVAPRVADPQLSPDGRTVLFAKTTTDGKTGRRNADIWSVPADGSGEAKALIAGDKTENTPRWSPNGKRIAFLANRDGATQVYVADADGSNVKKVTNLAAGVQPPLVWSPDSERVAFVSDVYPECTDEDCNSKKHRRGGAESGQGPPPDPVALPPLGRVARDDPASRVRCRRRRRTRARPDARRFRFAADAAGGRRDRLLARRENGRVRLEPRRQRQGSLDDQQRRLARAGRGRPGAEADAEPGRRHPSDVLAPTGARCSRCHSAGPASSPTAGTSMPTTSRMARSGRCSRHRTFRSATSRCRRTAERSGSRRRRTARDALFTVPFAGGTPTRVLRGRGDFRASTWAAISWCSRSRR